MITFIKSHESGKIVRREYSARNYSDAASFANRFSGSVLRLQEHYYRIII